MSNRLVALFDYGQSFWYDNIRRQFLEDGTVSRLISEDGLRGMTSNPSIFDQAVGKSSDYDNQIALLGQETSDTKSIYEALALADIRVACDLFSPLFAESNGSDGYVSLEVSPHLARDTEGTLIEARRLFADVDRPNVMIKVPATPEGIPAIRQLIGEGINVNVTLMFSMDHYEAVAQAYIDGLRQWVANGGDPRRVASVASFFVSRVDSMVDKQLAEIDDPSAAALLGKAAVANSRLVYQRYKEIFVDPNGAFAELASAGGATQRLLWASTSTKNPDYPDTMYIDELIGPDTVTTIPPATIDAFRDHGTLGHTLESDLDQAEAVMEQLAALDVDMTAVTERLQEDGVIAFANSFDSLFDTIESKRGELMDTAA